MSAPLSRLAARYSAFLAAVLALGWAEYQCDPYHDQRADRLEVAVCDQPGAEVCLTDLVTVATIPCRWKEWDSDGDGTLDQSQYYCRCNIATPTLSQIEDNLPPGAWLTVRACGGNSCSRWVLCRDGDWCLAEGGRLACFSGWPGLEVSCPHAAVELTLEPEEGILTPPLAGKDDSGDGTIDSVWPPPGSGVDSWPSTGRAEIGFYVPRSGRYAVWIRLKVDASDKDAVYVDGVRIWGQVKGEWTWERVGEYDLVEGEAIIVLGHAEPEATTERLWLTTRLDAVPGGE